MASKHVRQNCYIHSFTKKKSEYLVKRSRNNFSQYCTVGIARFSPIYILSKDQHQQYHTKTTNPDIESSKQCIK